MPRIDKLTEIAKKHAAEIIEEVDDEEGYEIHIVSKLLDAYLVSGTCLWN